MVNSVQARLDAVPFRVKDPEFIPAQRYYDAAFFELEKTRLWFKAWQMACRLEEIPEVGDFVEYAIFEKTVIVVNTPSGIKAFHNVCRHRGMKLVNGPGNCRKQGFICGFHGWRYDLDGKNSFVFGRDEFRENVLKEGELNLRPCRVETWAGCAFITFDDDAPSLIDSLGPHTKALDARNAGKLRTEWWYASVVPTNWKVVIEAFVENYHLMRTHPELHRLTAPLSSPGGTVPGIQLSAKDAVNRAADYLVNLSEGMGGLVHKSELEVIEPLRAQEYPDDPAEAVGAFFTRAADAVMRDGIARGLPMFDINRVNAEHPMSSNEHFFPNFFLLPMFGSMASYRIRPLTPETCLFEIWSLIMVPEGAVHESPKQATVLPYDSPDYPLIPQQDYSNMPQQQLGLRSGEIAYQRLSHDQEGMISNFQRLLDGFLAGLESDLLVKGQHVVNGGSFKPIRDLGFGEAS